MHHEQLRTETAGWSETRALRVRRYSVKSLAESHGIGMRQLQRIFRRERGVSPKKFLEAQRLEEARGRLLQGEGLKVIAEDLGYCDVPHLSRAFRRYFGVGPADYRRRIKSGADSPTNLASIPPSPLTLGSLPAVA